MNRQSLHRGTESRSVGTHNPRAAVTGPNTRWFPGESLDFPIEKLIGNDIGQSAGTTVSVESALYSAVAGSEESATPITRAQGQLIRLLPFSITWLALGVGVNWLLGLTWPYLLVWFSLLTAGTYLRMNRDEFEFSRNGLERRRIDQATVLRDKELTQTHELKMMALTAYLAIAKAQYLGVDDDTD